MKVGATLTVSMLIKMDPIEFFNRKHYDIIVEKGVQNDEKNSL